MPFMSRKYRARRRVRKPVAKLASGKRKTAIQKLAGAVARLQKKNRSDAEYLNFQYGVEPTGMESPAYIYPLNFYSGMTPIFGVSADDLAANKIIHKTAGVDMRVTLENPVNNEENTVGFTAFLVSLKDDIGSVFNPTTGAITLTQNVTHYINQGMALLNKKMFNIHRVKRFTLTNHGENLNYSSAQTQYGTDMRWYWKVAINKTIQNPQGNWKSLGSALDPSKNYYIIVFNDNSVIDLESPTVAITAVHTFKTVA